MLVSLYCDVIINETSVARG